MLADRRDPEMIFPLRTLVADEPTTTTWRSKRCGRCTSAAD